MEDISNDLTVQNLNEGISALRLKLTHTAEYVAGIKPNQPSFIENYVENLFWRARADIVLRTDTSREAFEMNMNKIEQIFDTMIEKIKKQKEDVKKEMYNITKQNYEDELKFWPVIREFFKNKFELLKVIFNKMIEIIIAGWRIIK